MTALTALQEVAVAAVAALTALGGHRLFTLKSDRRKAGAVADLVELERERAHGDLEKQKNDIYRDLRATLVEEFHRMEAEMTQARDEAVAANGARKDAEATSALLLTQLQNAQQQLGSANLANQDLLANAQAERRAMQAHLDEQSAEIQRLRARVAALEEELAAVGGRRRVGDSPAA